MTIKDRIAMMRAATAANQEYIKTAYGALPLTLTKTLAKPPESITVFGNSGGVGDYDSTKQAYKIPIILSDGTASKMINLYSDAELQSYTAHNLLYGATWHNGYMLNQEGTEQRSAAHKTTKDYIPIEPSTYYYLQYDVQVAFRRPCMYRYDAETDTYVCTRYVYNNAPQTMLIHTTDQETHIRVTAANADNRVLLVKSPVALDYFANDRLICDELAVSAKSRTAERVQRVTANGIISPITTDVAALQDWDGQDWKIPKADEVTVTAGTEREPEGMEIVYRSRKKE